MTRERVMPGEDAFRQWIRNCPQLDSRRYGFDLNDFDLFDFETDALAGCWFDFLRAQLRMLEVKCYYASPTVAQFDTFNALDQMLWNADGSVIERQFAGRPQKVTYLGWSIIQFEKTSPDTGAIRVDGVDITKDELIRFLRFEPVPKLDDVHKCRYRRQLVQILTSTTKKSLAQACNYVRRTVDCTVSNEEIARLRQARESQLKRMRTA